MSNHRFPKARTRFISAAVASCFATGVSALPVDPTVVAGSAVFHQAGAVLNVTNSNGAIINWQQFNIGAGETTRFIQPTASSAVLNRVLAADPSLLYGTLASNGKVFLVNPAGILVGAGARIDTAGFVASTLAIKDSDFLAGKLSFGQIGAAANGLVSNQGSITTVDGGSVYLIGANVSNQGIIHTPGGEAILAAGQTVQLVDTATPGVKVEITGDGTTTNLGSILADAGRIGLTGAIVRNSGTLNASSLVKEGGKVFLRASKDAYVDGSGRIVTTGTKGGSIEVLGNRVAVTDNASLDASGSTGGGTLLVGGDYQGKNPDVQNAQFTTLGSAASLNASATDQGDGGKVIVWADDTAHVNGSITLTGGPNGGKGGFVETSGHQVLNAAGIKVTAGAGGHWLLDPSDIQIAHGGNGYGGVTGSLVYDNDLAEPLKQNTSVTITTSIGSGGNGDITVDRGVFINRGFAGATSVTPGTPTLTLIADRKIDIGSSGSGNSVTIIAGSNASYGLSINLQAGTGGIKMTDTFLGAGNGGSMTLVSGGDIEVIGKNSNPALNYGGSTLLTTSGLQTITAVGALKVRVDTSVTGNNRFAGVTSAGGQVISADHIELTGGTAGYGNAAFIGNQDVRNQYGGFISAGGNQTITANRIILKAGGSGATDYNDGAVISNNAQNGSQTITITGSNGRIEAYGGAGGSGVSYGATPLAFVNNSCYGMAPLANCSQSQNLAAISSKTYGSQTVYFQYGGGSISLYGGSSGFENSAGIYLDTPDPTKVATAGSQSIYGGSALWEGPTIYMLGGASGGKVISDGTDFEDFRNSASIESEGSYSNINAASITLDGGGSAGTVGGAFIGGGLETTSISKSVSVYGALVITGGAGTTVTPAYGGGVYKLGTVAGIGSDNGSINVQAGSLSMTGGSGNSGLVLIGSPDSSANNLRVKTSGNILLQANAAGVAIGSLASGAGYGASVGLVSTGGSITATDSASAPVMIGAYGGGTSTNVTIVGAGNVSLGASSGAGTFIGNAARNGSLWIAAGTLDCGECTSRSATGGDLTINPTARLGSGSASLYASMAANGSNGNIFLKAGSVVSTTGNIYIEADRHVVLSGQIQGGYLDVDAGWNGAISLGGGRSSYGGNIAVYGGAVINVSGDVELDSYASVSYGGGLIGLAATSSITGERVHVGADRSVTVNGSITATTGYSYTGNYAVEIYAGDNSSYGGTLTLGSTSTITGYTFDLYAGHGTEGSGDIIQLAGSSITATGEGFENYLWADGNLHQDGTVTLSNGGYLYGYAGGDFDYDNKTLRATNIQAPNGGIVDLTSTGQIQVGVINAPGADVSLIAGYGYSNSPSPVLDNNGGALNITANSLHVDDSYGGSAGGLAVSLDTQVSNSVSVYVDSLATYGGISIRNQGNANIGIDFETNATYGGITFTNPGTGAVDVWGLNNNSYYGGGALVKVGGLLTNSEGSISSNTAGSAAVVLVTGGNFSYTCCSGIITPNGSWQVWSATDPESLAAQSGFNLPGYKFKQYNATYGVTPIDAGGSALLTAGYGGLFFTGQQRVFGSLTGPASFSKQYDGSTVLSIAPGSISPSLTIYGGGAVTLSGATGAFADKNVGVGKAVVLSNLNVTATDVGGKPVFGYKTISLPGVTGDITAAELTFSGLKANNKVYDGNDLAKLSGTLGGTVYGDDVTFLGSGKFSDKNVGKAKSVTVSTSGLTGADAGNYVVTGASAGTLTADITPLEISISGNLSSGKPITKEYDGSTKIPLGGSATLDGVLSGDTVTFSGFGDFADKNVGTGKSIGFGSSSLSGKDALNYIISGVPTSTLTGSITQRESVSWIGGKTGSWKDGLNWAGGAVPDLTNVKNVSIGSDVSVTFDVASASLVSLEMGGFNQSGGSLSVSSITVLGGSISQSGGALITPSLNATTVGGINLSGANQIGSFTASNSGSGNVVLKNSFSGLTGSVTNPVGSVTVDNNGATIINGVTSGATITLAAHSPLTINGTVSAGGSISLLADNGGALTQNANVTSTGGGSISVGGGTITMSPTAVTSTNGGTISLSATGNIVLGSLNAGSGAIAASSTSGGITTAPGAPKPNVIAKVLSFDTSGNNPIDIAIPAPATTKTAEADKVVNEVTKTVTSTTQTTNTDTGGNSVIQVASVTTPSSSSSAQTTGGTTGTFGDEKEKEKEKDNGAGSTSNKKEDSQESKPSQTCS